MKIKYLAAILLAGMIASACEQELQPVEKIVHELELSSGLTEIAAEQGVSKYTYSVKTEGEWRVVRKSYQKWASARPSEGKGDGEFDILVSENKTGASRSMSFVIYVDGEETEHRITVTQDGTKLIWDHQGRDVSSEIREGIPAYDATTLIYRQDGKEVLSILLGEPMLVAQSEEDDKVDWGYFQFPTLAQSEDGTTLQVSWQNHPDDEKYFGMASDVNKSNRRYSTDGGRTWKDAKADGVNVRDDGYNSVRLANRDILYLRTPATCDLRDPDLMALMPEPVEHRRNLRFYRVSELPDTLQGTEIGIWHASNNTIDYYKAEINDPGALRFSIESGYEYFPIKWWGDLKLLDNNEIAGVMYYSTYETASGNADPALSCSCYISPDGGHTWNLQGKIPYVYDAEKDPAGPGRWYYGYSEPAFEIADDGNWLTVLRTTDSAPAPLYVTRSSDRGKTWTDPVYFAPNGVMPRLQALSNGVVALSSGRPGVQLRFSIDGTGLDWTDPIEMVPYEEAYAKGKGNVNVSSGYSRIEKCFGEYNSFYIVYDVFNLDESNKSVLSKSIWLRKVTVDKL